MIKNKIVLEKLKAYNKYISFMELLIESHMKHRPEKFHKKGGQYPTSYEIYQKEGKRLLKEYCSTIYLKDTFLEGYIIGKEEKNG